MSSRDRLAATLARLPDSQRAAFDLLKREGLTLAEAAAILGVTVTAVKLRAHRAYVSLRGTLRDHLGDLPETLTLMTFVEPSHDPAHALRRRVLAAVRTEPAPTRQRMHRHAWWLIAVGSTVAGAIFVQLGGLRQYDRPTMLVVASSLGWSVIASAAVWIGVRREARRWGDRRRLCSG